jgi:hypothetical protein
MSSNPVLKASNELSSIDPSTSVNIELSEEIKNLDTQTKAQDDADTSTVADASTVADTSTSTLSDRCCSNEGLALSVQ